MAGLLDFLDHQTGDGLLGKLSFQPTPASMGLLNAAGSILASGAPSHMPISPWAQLGNGLLAFAQGQQSQQKLERDQVLQQQEMAMKKAFYDAQLAHYQQQKPEQPAAITEALWAANGDQSKARDLMSQWKTNLNPLGMQQYLLALNQANAAQQNRTHDNQLADRQDARANEEHAMRMANEHLIAIPATQIDAHISNNSEISKIDNAIEQIRSNPEALGMKNYFGDTLTQRTDKNGVPVRAAVADVGGGVFHDLSGAAVSASEANRLKPYIPAVTDTAETALKKLEGLKREYLLINQQRQNYYTQENGYRNNLPAYTSPSQPNGAEAIPPGRQRAVSIDPKARFTPQEKQAIQADMAKGQPKPTVEELLKLYGK